LLKLAPLAAGKWVFSRIGVALQRMDVSFVFNDFVDPLLGVFLVLDAVDAVGMGLLGNSAQGVCVGVNGAL
jgi:hypothetical protein